jgi:NADPH:quinone reductase-like Zn-dependent oxidoreductase
VQIAKAMGGVITGVCSAKNAELVRSLGAERTVDYTTQDYTRTDERYDVIIDNVGNRSLSENRRILAPGGRYLQIGGGGPNDGKWLGPLGRFVSITVMSWFGSQHFGMMLASANAADLAALADLMTSGKVTPAIDREFPLDDTPAAIRYVEDGHARAKVVVTVK